MYISRKFRYVYYVPILNRIIDTLSRSVMLCYVKRDARLIPPRYFQKPISLRFYLRPGIYKVINVAINLITSLLQF